MTEILRYEVGSGTVLVEVADDSYGVERPSRNEQGITDAGRRLEDALAAIRPAANAAAEGSLGRSVRSIWSFSSG